MKQETEEGVALLVVGTILLVLMGLIGFGACGESMQDGFYQFLTWFWY